VIWSRTGITLALGIIILSARPVLCQQLQLIEAGVKPPNYVQIGDTRPSGFVLTSRSAVGQFSDLLWAASLDWMWTTHTANGIIEVSRELYSDLVSPTRTKGSPPVGLGAPLSVPRLGRSESRRREVVLGVRR